MTSFEMASHEITSSEITSSEKMHSKYKKYKSKYLKLKSHLSNNPQIGGNMNQEECNAIYDKLNSATNVDMVTNLYNAVIPVPDQTWNKVKMPSRLIKRENFHVYKQIIQNYIDKLCGKSEIDVIDLGHINSSNGYPTSGNDGNSGNSGYPTNGNSSNGNNGYPTTPPNSPPVTKNSGYSSWFSFMS